MVCSSCGQRKARRDCPALRHSICTVCCGTKRLVEIDCPDDCPHLAAAREHPAAQVKRQQERDVAVLLPSIRHLSERQYQLFFLFHTAIARHRPEGFGRIIDEDVAEATAAVAATLETAVRGVIYQHMPQSRAAHGLANEMTTLLGEIRSQGGKVYDGEAAIVLRAIEHGAREVSKASAGETTYLALMTRLLQVKRAEQHAGSSEPSKGQNALILP